MASKSKNKFKTETDLSVAVLKALRNKYKQDIFIYKTHGNMFSLEGIPDLEACFNGKYIAMELKLPSRKNTLSDEQKARIRQIRRAGGVAYRVTTVEEAIEIFRRAENE